MADDPIERGWELLDNGKIDEARKLADRAVIADPKSPEAHTLVGAVANSEGDIEAALEAFERAMASGLGMQDVSAVVEPLREV